jgi:hypothetical protein
MKQIQNQLVIIIDLLQAILHELRENRVETSGDEKILQMTPEEIKRLTTVQLKKK